ncbi:50S ribosomal protein L25/general stress protein Ctc [Gryllotalpicola ginsengisoli]|uniref:50S ribosomal protein L25/general stress protein Ctc n=1 Tax=Gryllotalpicola ginsengisoli TaxID=444608 RepID=UPI0003B75AB3|nr:50S ribosomal protein L25/general stress protein Ctc [Gryllotalpicola ginsengisoli]
MADELKLVAEVRDSFGKGAARKIRAANKIPAVVYGHGTEPRHVTLPGHETMLLVRKANAVIELDIAGTPALALVKDVQRDPVRQIIEHVDLIVVRKGEKVTVDVPVHVEGEPFGSAIAELDQQTLSVEAEATNIPERLVVDVEGKEAGTHITAGELELPAGVSLLTDAETLVVGIVEPAAPAAEETEAAEGAAEAEAAEEPAEESAE